MLVGLWGICHRDKHIMKRFAVSFLAVLCFPEFAPQVSMSSSGVLMSTLCSGFAVFVVAPFSKSSQSGGLTMMGRHNDAKWNIKFSKLKQFKSVHGHVKVPRQYNASSLGTWTMTQRTQYKRFLSGEHSTLTPERARRLESIGFDLGRTNAPWSLRLLELLEFKAECGHCLVPQIYPANKPLGFWVATQRAQYKRYREGLGSTLTKDRVQRLMEAGFDFGPRVDFGWEDRYDQLCAYKQEHGHCKTSEDYNPFLHKWLTSQKKQYKLKRRGKQSSLTDEKIRLLEEVGVVLENDGKKPLWDKKFDEYKKAALERGPTSDERMRRRVAKFVRQQRHNYQLFLEGKPSSLDADRIRKLESVGFFEKHSVGRTAFQIRFEELKQFRATHGHTRVPQQYKPNPQLGRWVNKQRQAMRKLQNGERSPMTESRLDSLKSIDFVFKV